MKRVAILLFAVLMVFSYCVLAVSAEDYDGESSTAVYESSPYKKWSWAYWVTGILTVGGVTAAAILISKRKE